MYRCNSARPACESHSSSRLCSEVLRVLSCGGPLACCRAPRLVAYRVDEDEQDGEEDGEEESEERDGDHERHLNEKDPRKSEGQSLGCTDACEILNENSKRSVTGPRNGATRCVSA